MAGEIDFLLDKIKPITKINVYGHYATDCRLEVNITGKNTFLRVKKDNDNYIFEDVARTLKTEKKETTICTREEVIDKVMDKAMPIINQVEKENYMIDILDRYLLHRNVVIKTKSNRIQIVGHGFAGEYIMKNADSIAVYKEKDKRCLDDKYHMTIEQFVNMKENALTILPKLYSLTPAIGGTLLEKLGCEEKEINYKTAKEFLEKLKEFCRDGENTHYTCWQDVFEAYKESLEKEKNEEEQRVKNLKGTEKQVAWANDIMKDVSVYLDEIQNIADSIGETEQIERILERDGFFSVRDALNTIRNCSDTNNIIKEFKSFDLGFALQRLNQRLDCSGMDGEFKNRMIKTAKQCIVCEVLELAVFFKRKEGKNKKMKFTDQWFKVGDIAHMRENKRGNGIMLKNRMPVKIVGVHKYGKSYHYDIEVTHPKTKEVKVLEEWVTQDNLIPPDMWEEMKKLKIVE